MSSSTSHFCSLLVLTHCQGNIEPEKTPGDDQALALNEQFGAYVSGFTAGEISRRSPVVIQLAVPFAANNEVGNPVTEELLPVFDPAIDGSATWRDRRTIEFTPAVPLEPGQTYEAELDMTRFYSDLPAEVNTLAFQFWTRPRTFTVDIAPLKATENSSLQSQVLEGRIVSSDYEDPTAIEALLSVRYQNQDLDIQWQHDSDYITHTFKVDGIERQDQAAELLVRWNASSLDVDFRGEEKITVPPLQSFSFVSARSRLSPERSVVVHFSDPIDPNQNLDGLIRLGNYDLRFTVEGNQVTVYPASTVRTFSGNVNLQVEAGIRNVAGSKIQSRHEVPLEFKEINPAVKLTGKGSDYANRGEFTVFF